MISKTTIFSDKHDHVNGSKEHDKFIFFSLRNITATDSYTVGLLALGEGWHNYHHCFPWDYKTAESTKYWFNPSLIFIDLAAFMGLATDLKTVPKNMIRERVLRTGDGSHKYSKDAVDADIEANNNHTAISTEHFWGWGE